MFQRRHGEARSGAAIQIFGNAQAMLKKELLFVNKKKQKNFINLGPGTFNGLGVSGPKVFWFFFSKKNILFLLTFYL